MIDDLDKTLAALLAQQLPTDLAQQVQISFAPPDSSFPPAGVTLPAVDLFLYDVRENTDLRSNDPAVATSNGRASETPPAVRVDCSYLVTAWPSDSTPTPAEDEHRLLGEVTLVLLANATLPQGVLQGGLQSQELPLPTGALQPGRLQSVGEFWQALGGKPKATLSYTVTIALQPGAAVDLGPVVTEKRLLLEQISD
jgi:hypothetical protein